MRRKILCAAIATLLLTSTTTLFAQRGSAAQTAIEVKLGSQLPQNSHWGRALDRLAAEWSRITNGQVRVNVRHGAIEGSEAKMGLSLASNTIQAAVLTTFGLSEIYPGIMTLSVPFLIRTDAELTAVMNELQSDLEARINSGDNFMLAWSKPGFVNIFSKNPILTPDDLRRHTLASNAEAGKINTTFKTMGFNVVEGNMSDVGPKMAAGTVNAIYQVPTAVMSLRLHDYMKYMLNIPLAPTLGGIVINQVTWRKIIALNPRYQNELVTVARQIAAEIDRSMQTTERDAINTMTRGGLTINRPTAAQEQIWYNEIERVIPGLLGTTYDRALYQRITDILTRYRAGR